MQKTANPHVVKVSVIVPYFQNDEGILKSVVQSAFNQLGDIDYEVIVVDDESPVPAEMELSDLLEAYPSQLKIIHQKNAGPGAARNKGIENVRKGTEYIAFLDSDDHWVPGHLENAVHALNRDFDFYLSDFYFADYKEESAFERGGKIKKEDHQCIDEGRQLYQYMDSMMDQILIKGNVIGTPTVAYRYKKYPDLRFREQFYNGQDYVFWMDFAQTGGSIAVSFQKECDCGVGLNIYAGAGWGTERSIERLSNELYLWSSVKKMYELTNDQNSHNNQKIASIKEAIVRDIFHRLTHLKKVKVSTLKKLYRTSPSLIYKIPLVFYKMLKEKLM
jgi:succinoglycan biosynthesis protein ExoW